jgi:hypothetical protein
MANHSEEALIMTTNFGTATIKNLCWLFVFTCAGRSCFADIDVRPFAADLYNALSSDDRMSLIINTLEARDRELSNLRCKWRERIEVVAMPSGSRDPRSLGTVYELRRMSGLWRIDGTYERAGGEPGEISQVGSTVWDGKESRTLSKNFKVSPSLAQRAMVDGTEPSAFISSGYMEILGLRTNGIFSREFRGTVGEWIWSEKQIGRLIEVPPINSDTRLVMLTLYETKNNQNSIYRNYFFDPTKGFMISKVESVVEIPSKSLREPTVTDVDEARLISGVWLPTHVIRRFTSNETPDTMKMTTYEVEEVSIGSATQEDFVVNFPPDVLVVDSIRRISYFPTKGGAFRLRAYGDRAANAVNVPITQMVDKIDDNIRGKYKSLPLILARPSDGKTSKIGSERAICFIAAVLTATISIALWIRYRGTRIQS